MLLEEQLGENLQHYREVNSKFLNATDKYVEQLNQFCINTLCGICPFADAHSISGCKGGELRGILHGVSVNLQESLKSK